MLIFSFVLLFLSCSEKASEKNEQSQTTFEVIRTTSEASLVVLGTLQDAGSPHIGCNKDCCASFFENPDPLRKVVSLGLIDSKNNKNYLFEATPDISTQLKHLKHITASNKELPDGIFLTHAHIGHYSGLMYLGKEATNADSAPVFAMPRMKEYLETNGPWSQLVKNSNIAISQLKEGWPITLSSSLSVTPFKVPHRDEFSETVGFIIAGPNKLALFIPDIDKWEKWSSSIKEVISTVDYAFIDATFYHGDEINSRDISGIPHPFIIESMELLKDLPSEEKQKIQFIHFNHTNPVLNTNSDAFKIVIKNGFNVAKFGDVFDL
ncbi:pyrroloquinoline quinone biosynthesis protein B [Ulvibacter antarcticus]|uniref:Pyrroloquinoline quinone biosynthesis protein B n=1 Tax=Ulvibacter antarcticus TaxID=442714 RepID=A0A3L9Z440_9FLAO|nr:pyrroloquinoline quinone biosynthesis protein B [Ulvibacter antarcticus]